MVTDAIVDAVSAFIVWLLGALPTIDLPDYLTGNGPGTLAGLMGSVLGALGGLGGWLPASQLAGAAALVLAGIVTTLGVKLLRIIASFLTAGGGSAA